MPRDKHHSSEPRATQRLPSDHFEADGLSRGKATGAVRKSYDAHLEQREPQKQEGDIPPGPRQ